MEPSKCVCQEINQNQVISLVLNVKRSDQKTKPSIYPVSVEAAWQIVRQFICLLLEEKVIAINAEVYLFMRLLNLDLIRDRYLL